MACFTSSVAFWKQQWCVESSGIKPVQPGPEEHQILEQIGSVQSIQGKADLFNFLNMRMSAHKQASCQYLSTLIWEFFGKSVVPYHLPMEFHKSAYRLFERENLEDCLKIPMGALSQIVSLMPEEVVAASLVQANINVLSWDFGGAEEWMHLPSS
jgi:hypothetical protein